MQQNLNQSYSLLVKNIKEKLVDILIDFSLEENKNLWQSSLNILKEITDDKNIRIKLKYCLKFNGIV